MIPPVAAAAYAAALFKLSSPHPVAFRSLIFCGMGSLIVPSISFFPFVLSEALPTPCSIILSCGVNPAG
jgi:hypothetical protein